RLVQQLLGRAAEHNGARLASRNTRELDQRVLANDDLLDQVTLAQLDLVRVVKRRRNLAASDKRQAVVDAGSAAGPARQHQRVAVCPDHG
ncbi:MAG: hypothetical protein E7K47_15810, partial [Acidovorax sp.]|nr:hypothetical protein [Acidovorax sp.]